MPHLQGIFPTQGSNPHLLFLALAGGFFTTSATCEALRTAYFIPLLSVSNFQTPLNQEAGIQVNPGSSKESFKT